MTEIVSDCCGARIYDDSDICSKCKEHCAEVDLDKEEKNVK